MLSTLVAVLSLSSVAQDPIPPKVIQNDLIKITSSALRKTEGDETSLVVGDMVESTTERLPGRIQVSQYSYILMMKNSKVKFMGYIAEDPIFDLIDGQIIYASLNDEGKSKPNVGSEQIPVGGTVRRKRLLRAGSKSIGTAGTVFSAQIVDPAGKNELRIHCIEGKIEIFHGTNQEPELVLSAGQYKVMSAKNPIVPGP